MIDRNIALSWSDEVCTKLGTDSYDPRFGARPLKRLIQNKVINMLSTAILEGSIVNNSSVSLLLNEEGLITYKLEYVSTQAQEYLINA